MKIASALLAAGVAAVALSASLALENEKAETRIGALSTFQAQGQGSQATKKFNLKPGLAVFQIEGNGKSNFIIDLIDGASGKSVANLVNEIGKFDGTLATGIRKEGEYLLKIQGDGAWDVAVGQPKPAEITKPGNIQGQGYDVSEFVGLNEGLAVFEFDYQGEGPFSVWMLDANGKPVEHLLNVRGKYHGSKPTNIEEQGTYLFNVEAEGNWTVKIEQ